MVLIMRMKLKRGNVGKLGARERAREIKGGQRSDTAALVGSLGLDLGGSSLGRGSNLGGGLSRLGDRGEDGGLLLGLEDGDGIGKGEGLAGTSLGVPALHDLDLDSENTLLHENVTNSLIDKVLDGLTGVDHESVGELHRLGTGSTQLTRNDDLATLGTGLHDEAEHTVGGTADGKTTEELVAERLALGDGVETTVLHLLGVELERVVGELESLLDEGGELADAATLITENLLGVGGTDDDLGTGVGDTDLTTRVSLLGELTSEELVELGGENTVSDKLETLKEGMQVNDGQNAALLTRCERTDSGCFAVLHQPPCHEKRAMQCRSGEVETIVGLSVAAAMGSKVYGTGGGSSRWYFVLSRSELRRSVAERTARRVSTSAFRKPLCKD